MDKTKMNKIRTCSHLLPDPGGEVVRELLDEMEAHNKLTASEAIFGFAGWLTTRPKKTVMSSSDDAAPIVELIQQFCEVNNLDEARDGWENNLTHPD